MGQGWNLSLSVCPMKTDNQELLIFAEITKGFQGG